MFRNIMVPVDESRRCEEAMKIAVGLATDTVYPLHVIEVIADTTFEEFEDFYLRLERQALRDMDSLLAFIDDTGPKIEPKIVYGARAAQILQSAENLNIDLIVMQSHRIDPQDPTRGWGTLSHKIGILASCPVMLVK